MRNLRCVFRVFLLVTIITSCQQKKEIELFDGQTFTGWEGSSSAFRIENNSIIGGNLEKGLDNNFYLCTTEEYSDFELTLSAKLIYTNIEEANAGVYFRSKRTRPNRVGGYEADIGYIKPSVVARITDYSPIDMNIPFSLWGSLIDEGRDDASRYPNPEGYPVVPLKFSNRELILKIVKQNEWNEIKVIAHGNEIEIKINGIATAQYTEMGKVPSKGYICLQVHKEPYEVHYKDIRIRKID